MRGPRTVTVAVATRSAAHGSMRRTRSSKAATPSSMSGFGGVLDVGVREPVDRRDEHHHRRDARARHLGRVVHRAGRHDVADTRAQLHHVGREADQIGVEGDRVDRPEHVDLGPDALLRGDRRDELSSPETSESSTSRERWRMSTLNSVRPFTAVGTLGCTRHTPTVVKASWARPRSRIATAMRAAATVGSRRRGSASRRRGTPGPAGARAAARPRGCRAARRAAARRPRASGPARCGARPTRRSTPCTSPAVRTVSNSTPCSATTSPSRRPWLSTRSRTASMSSVPLTAPDPNSDRPNRAPSSSAQSTTLTDTGNSTPSRWRPRSTSAPASTPRQPSSHPPFGTESRWLPSTIRSGRAPGSVTHRFPAGSVLVSTGMPSKVAANQSRARCHGSVQARRALPSGGAVGRTAADGLRDAVDRLGGERSQFEQVGDDASGIGWHRTVLPRRRVPPPPHVRTASAYAAGVVVRAAPFSVAPAPRARARRRGRRDRARGRAAAYAASTVPTSRRRWSNAPTAARCSRRPRRCPRPRGAAA